MATTHNALVVEASELPAGLELFPAHFEELGPDTRQAVRATAAAFIRTFWQETAFKPSARPEPIPGLGLRYGMQSYAGSVGRDPNMNPSCRPEDPWGFAGYTPLWVEVSTKRVIPMTDGVPAIQTPPRGAVTATLAARIAGNRTSSNDRVWAGVATNGRFFPPTAVSLAPKWVDPLELAQGLIRQPGEILPHVAAIVGCMAAMRTVSFVRQTMEGLGRRTVPMDEQGMHALTTSLIGLSDFFRVGPESHDSDVSFWVARYLVKTASAQQSAEP